MSDSKMHVLITGANGALGKAVATALLDRGHSVVGATRQGGEGLPPGATAVAIGRLDGQTDWTAALNAVTHIVHCAALTTVPAGGDPAAFDAVNCAGTRRLAEQAVAAGVRRLVHISTAAVTGREAARTLATVASPPLPADAYARSKLAAERALQSIAATAPMEVVIIRPPRIVWPELTGNLRLFERLIARGIPLPLGAVDGNARDRVSPSNLVSLITLCLLHDAAAGQVFFATDGDPLSTRAMTERIARRTGRAARLIPVPTPILRAIIALMPHRFLGGLTRAEMASELLDDFRLDIAPNARLLGWMPGPGEL